MLQQEDEAGDFKDRVCDHCGAIDSSGGGPPPGWVVCLISRRTFPYPDNGVDDETYLDFCSLFHANEWMAKATAWPADNEGGAAMAEAAGGRAS